jgi:hypothetical protein
MLFLGQKLTGRLIIGIKIPFIFAFPRAMKSSPWFITAMALEQSRGPLVPVLAA